MDFAPNVGLTQTTLFPLLLAQGPSASGTVCTGKVKEGPLGIKSLYKFIRHGGPTMSIKF